MSSLHRSQSPAQSAAPSQAPSGDSKRRNFGRRVLLVVIPVIACAAIVLPLVWGTIRDRALGWQKVSGLPLVGCAEVQGISFRPVGPESDEFLIACASDASDEADIYYTERDGPGADDGLSRAPRLPMFRFVAASRTLRAATWNEWTSSDLAVSGAAAAKAPSILRPGFWLDFNSHTLSFADRPVDTAKTTVIAAAASPDARFVAALSVGEYTPARPGLIFGGAPCRVDGPCVVELFRTSDGSRAGSPIRLNGCDRSGWVDAVWTSDSKHVVCSETPLQNVPSAPRIWVIDAPKN